MGLRTAVARPRLRLQRSPDLERTSRCQPTTRPPSLATYANRGAVYNIVAAALNACTTEAVDNLQHQSDRLRLELYVPFL